jgi:hypothetical protein
MINQAGALVQPTVASVQAAMQAFQTQLAAGELALYILDPPATSPTAWPMSYLLYAAIRTNITSSSCTSTQALLNFISWVQLNGG